jgi:hypothetical protein
MSSWIDAIMRLISGPEASATGAAPSDAGVSDARGLWLAWSEMRYPKDYPPGSTAGVVDGVDLALSAGDLAKTFHLHFTDGLGEADRLRLEAEMRQLERIVPMLRGDGRPYFAAARSVGRWILRGSPS